MAPSEHTQNSTASDWDPGDIILGLYEVREVLGRGGMGTVYRVHHRAWGIDLAVKRPRADVFASALGAQLFEKECETWIKLGLHPNVVTCYYARRIDEIPNVFAEYVAGGTLTKWIHDGRLYDANHDLALMRMLDVSIQFGRGLLHAHTHRIVHHDVKPANVLIAIENGNDSEAAKLVAKVTDFGMAGAIVAALTEKNATRRSERNPRGTPLYCSPEQSRREDMTVATDIWSYGLSLLEMFAGDATWMAGQTAPAALESYRDLGPERPDIPQMPESVADLLERCFRAAPADRPHGMQPVLDVLASCYEEIAGEPYALDHAQSAETSLDRLSNRAVSLLDLGNDREAERVWKEILTQDPNHVAAAYNQALNRWRTGRLTDVSFLLLLESLHRRSPAAWTPLHCIAEVQLERGDTEGALKILHETKKLRVDRHEFRTVRASIKEQDPFGRRKLRDFGDHNGRVSAAAISWDGRMVLSASRPVDGDGEVKLWAGATGKLVRIYSGHSGPVYTVDLSGDGKFAVSGGEDGIARLWHLQSGRCARTLVDHEGAVTAARFTEDGRRVVTADEAGVARLWEIDSAECKREMRGHKGAIVSVCLAEFGRSIMTAGADGTLRFWNLSNGQCLRSFAAASGAVTTAAISGDRRYLVAGSGDGHLQVWDLKNGKTSGERRAHTTGIRAIAVSKKGGNALTASGNKKFRIWDMRSGRCLTTLRGDAPIALTGDSQIALTGDGGSGLQLWHVRCDHKEHQAPYLLCRADGHAASTPSTVISGSEETVLPGLVE